jgi:hypothetical protein
MNPLEIKTILIPFDFQEKYLEPIKMGIEISNKSNAKLTLLYAINPIENAMTNYFKGMILPLYKNKMEEFEFYNKQVRKYLLENGIKHEKYNLLIKTNTIFNAIELVNSKYNFNLIIIPDKSRSGLDRLLSDINAIKLMQVTKTAVIAVPEKASPIKNIVLPIRNIKNWYSKVQFTMTIAKITGATVYMIGIGNTNSVRIINQVKKKVELCKRYFTLNEINHFIEFSFCHGDTAFDVHNLSLYKNADLIVVSPPGNKSKLNSYLNISLYNKLREKGDVPIMGVATN